MDAPAPRRKADWARFGTELGGIPCITDPAVVRQKSRDFFWYSPILKAQLDRIIALEDGLLTVEPGRKMADVDAATRPQGWELRMHPSTKRTATIGGFIAGGSGGAGSITWGGLRDPGNVAAARVVSCEEAPRVVTLAGDAVAGVNHAYGTTGTITASMLAWRRRSPGWTSWPGSTTLTPQHSSARRWDGRTGCPRSLSPRSRHPCPSGSATSKSQRAGMSCFQWWPGTLKFIRVGGRVTCSGLLVLRFTTAERLAEIVAHHERRGVLVASPHFYTLEDGTGHKRVGETQPAMKADMDPLALLNPGKMRSYAPAA